MTLLSRYIAYEFAKFFSLFVTAFTFIIIVGNLFSQLGDAFASVGAFLGFLRSTALLLPALLEMILPMTALLATIATFSALSRGSELVAMRASGLGYLGLARPVLAVALLIALGSYLNQSHLYGWMQGRWGASEEGGGLPAVWKTGEDGIYYYGPRTGGASVEGAAYFEWRASEPFRLSRRLEAASLALGAGGWTAEGVAGRLLDDAGVRRDPAATPEEARLTFPPVAFSAPPEPATQSLGELAEGLRVLTAEGQDTTRHWMAFHQKLSGPMTVVVMVLLGLSLSMGHSRQGRGGESAALAFLLGVLFWLGNQIFTAVGAAGALHPAVAAWSANLIFLAVAFLLARRNRV